MPKDKRLYMTFPIDFGPNGDLADPGVLRVGRSFRANWAFLDDDPAYYEYEVFDRHKRMIYVGITDCFPARWSSHLRTSWWSRSVDIRYVMLTGYLSKFEARVVEALMIAEHRPPCNVKPERKYLRIAQSMEMPVDVMQAELVPVRKF